MTSYPATLLPSPPYYEIDIIIFSLWDKYLELEFSKSSKRTHLEQHLEVTTAVIEYWEEILKEINTDEIQQRRSNSGSKRTK